MILSLPHHHLHYQKFRCALVFIALLWFLAYGQTSIFVCMPGKQNTQQIQNGLNLLLGPGQAMVFGKIKDLEVALQTTPVAAVIAPSAYFDYVREYKVVFAAKNGKLSGEKYMILAVAEEITRDNISEKKVGMVDFIGKDRLAQFVKDKFDVEIKILKKVNKDIDLLTMLGTETVDAIVVSTSQYSFFLSSTKLPLRIIATSKTTIGFAECAAKDGRIDEKVKNALLKSPVTLNKELGIDGWEVR